MNILVTGASGYLGSFLCPLLESQGNKVTKLNSKNADLTTDGSLKIYRNEIFDQIFHLAAWTQAGDFCLHHPGEQWLINQKINTNLLDFWKNYQPQAKLISIGSSCVYSPEKPLAEEHYTDGLPTESLYYYAMTKRMLYVGQQALSQQFGLNYLCIIPSTLFGPNYPLGKKQPHFIFDLIQKIATAKYRGSEVILWGDGLQVRELIYIEDFVQILCQLSNSCNRDIINIGSGEGHTIQYFAQEICKRIDFDFHQIQFDTQKYVGVRSKVLNIKKLKNLIPDCSLTPLQFGLDKTVDWYLHV